MGSLWSRQSTLSEDADSDENDEYFDAYDTLPGNEFDLQIDKLLISVLCFVCCFGLFV